MEYEWDEHQRQINREKHAVDFLDAIDFDWHSAISWVDDRNEDGEIREIALGWRKTQLYVMVFTLHNNKVRIISLRRARPQEKKIYAQAIN
jgi:uncharacterized DUF497 family protein